MDFVYFFEETVYHTMLNNPETIDPRSVQHQGSNALSMTRYLGNLDLTEAQSPTTPFIFGFFAGYW